jgi:glycerophosphoryl diester phosphodiesterase
MKTLKDLPRPAIFAHRGASAHAPENTLAAFQLAIRHGCDGIELDAMLSGDQQVMVIHDSDLFRTTGFKARVNELPLTALKQLDAGSFFDIEFQNEKIPTLEEVFEAVGKQTIINIELKNYESINDNLPEKVADLVIQFGLQSSVIFSSFNPIALRKIKKRLPSTNIGLLALPGRAGWWARSWPGSLLVAYDAIHPERSDVDTHLVQHFHKRNKRVHVYTINLPEEMSRQFALGVDGIFTDDPVLAVQIKSDLHPSTSLAE